MNFLCQLMIFAVGGQRYALDISKVQRVVRIVEITPFSGLPSVIAGIINMHGEVVPVISMRRCCALPERGIELSDRLIVLGLERRNVALWVDEVFDLQDCNETQWVPAEEVLNKLAYVAGVFKNREELVILHDPEGYLSRNDHDILDRELTASQ